MSGSAEGRSGGGELRIPLSVQLAVYATGTFGNSINNVVTVLIPLWALHLGASPS